MTLQIRGDIRHCRQKQDITKGNYEKLHTNELENKNEIYILQRNVIRIEIYDNNNQAE